MTIDYAELADVKAWLHIVNDSDDALLARMVTAASAWVATYLSREVALSSHVATYDGAYGVRQMLVHTPVVSVTSVSIDDAALAAASFKHDVYGVLLRDRRFPRGYGNVTIAYTAGYVDVPDDIVQCVIDIVAFNYRRRERIGHNSKSIGGETVSFSTADVPAECKQVLQQYRRVVPV